LEKAEAEAKKMIEAEGIDVSVDSDSKLAKMEQAEQEAAVEAERMYNEEL